MEDKRYYRCSEVSSYGVKMGFVDMRALGEAVGGVLNLNIVRRTEEEGLGHWEVENGTLNWHYDCENNQYSDEEATARIKELTELVEAVDDELSEEDLDLVAAASAAPDYKKFLDYMKSHQTDKS